MAVMTVAPAASPSTHLAATRGLLVLRVAVASLLFMHGLARAWYDGVGGFGGWLDSLGLPLGLAIAWTITVVELLGTPLLAAGRFVVPLAIWYSLQLAVGVALVHFSEGWWVVGRGRNGMEYSVLLIASLLALVVAHWRRPQR